MKNSLLLFSILFFLCINLAEAQTSLPDSSHVLVVYNFLDQTSIDVKNYYQQRRGIPESNIVPLNSLFNQWITDPATQDSHYIELRQQGEAIVDTFNTNTWCATKHAWIYFNEKIAKPIANYLNTTYVNNAPLKDIVRFIAIAKGVPFKIHARTAIGGNSESRNVVVDRLLCLVGETIDDPDALLDYFWADSCFYNPFDDFIVNPYYNVDPNFSMEENFLPNHYSKSINLFGQPRDLTLSYLVSRLDAPFLDTVKSMIDRSIAAINSSNYDWFIDSDPAPCSGAGFLKSSNTKEVFDALGITNYFIDNTETIYTNYNIKPIMSYSSNGIWTSVGPGCDVMYFDSSYIQSQLTFTYAPGAIFNTAESFNGNTIGTWPIIRLNGQGQIPEFMLTGGTVGVCQAYHGTNRGGSRIIDNSIMLPSYAMGYTFIEAAYMGMNYLTDERVFIGDPLTRIAYPCEGTVLTSDTTISSGDYNCDIIVPEGITLTIAASSNINFGRNVALKIEGNLNIEDSVTIFFKDFS